MGIYRFGSKIALLGCLFLSVTDASAFLGVADASAFLGVADASAFLGVADASAAGPFRCNGRIQFRPCDMPFPGARELSAPPQQISSTGVKSAVTSEPKILDSSLFATVLEQRFNEHRPTSKAASKIRQGDWRGIVDGNGEVHLELQILRNGTEESRQFMGSVVLINQPSTFHFVGSLPSGNDWSWNVLARVKQPS